MTNQQPSLSEILMAGRITDHLAHCPGCRERSEASAARAAAYGASIRRRDRLTLGLHRLPSRPAVTA